VVKEYWFWLGYEFLYISWDGMGVLTSRLGGRPTVDQQPASRMKKRGTWVAKCSPNRAGSGGCGCEWGGGLKGPFIDWGSWLERVSVDRICGGINFGERIIRNGVRTAEL